MTSTSTPEGESSDAQSIAGAEADAGETPPSPDSDEAAPEGAGAEGASDEAPAEVAEPTGAEAGSEATVAAEAGGPAAEGAGEPKKKKRRKKRKKKPVGPAEGDDKAVPFLRFFGSTEGRRHGFSVGEVVAGRVTKVENGAIVVDLFGKAEAIADEHEPHEVPPMPEPRPEPEAQEPAQAQAVVEGEAPPVQASDPSATGEAAKVAGEEQPGTGTGGEAVAGAVAEVGGTGAETGAASATEAGAEVGGTGAETGAASATEA
ncbi:MAG: hypothetical protein ACOCXM_07645, partial [Myxococcota bacterium]